MLGIQKKIYKQKNNNKKINKTKVKIEEKCQDMT